MRSWLWLGEFQRTGNQSIRCALARAKSAGVERLVAACWFCVGAIGLHDSVHDEHFGAIATIGWSCHLL
eukprot:6817426-Prymnesium_polylepis.1